MIDDFNNSADNGGVYNYDSNSEVHFKITH